VSFKTKGHTGGREENQG